MLLTLLLLARAAAGDFLATDVAVAYISMGATLAEPFLNASVATLRTTGAFQGPVCVVTARAAKRSIIAAEPIAAATTSAKASINSLPKR